MSAPQDQKKEEFKQYLDKAGVLELLTSNLVKLYEEPEKPNDALEYLKNNIGGSKTDKEEIAKLTSENDDLKKKIEELEKKEAELREKLTEVTTLKGSEMKNKLEEMAVVDAPNDTTVVADASVDNTAVADAPADTGVVADASVDNTAVADAPADTGVVADASVDNTAVVNAPTDTAAVSDTEAMADASDDTADTKMETPAATELSTSDEHQATDGEKKDVPVEEAMETEDVPATEPTTTNPIIDEKAHDTEPNGTEEEKVAEEAPKAADTSDN